MGIDYEVHYLMPGAQQSKVIDLLSMLCVPSSNETWWCDDIVWEGDYGVDFDREGASFEFYVCKIYGDQYVIAVWGSMRDGWKYYPGWHGRDDYTLGQKETKAYLADACRLMHDFVMRHLSPIYYIMHGDNIGVDEDARLFPDARTCDEANLLYNEAFAHYEVARYYGVPRAREGRLGSLKSSGS